MTTRVVDPWRVFHAFGAWYLAAWCHRADGERLFRVDRVRAVRPTGEHFEPRVAAPTTTTPTSCTARAPTTRASRSGSRPTADVGGREPPARVARRSATRRLVAGRARGQRDRPGSSGCSLRLGPGGAGGRPAGAARARRRAPPARAPAPLPRTPEPGSPASGSRAVDLRGWGRGASSVTDDVDAPTVVDTSGRSRATAVRQRIGRSRRRRAGRGRRTRSRSPAGAKTPLDAHRHRVGRS